MRCAASFDVRRGSRGKCHVHIGSCGGVSSSCGSSQDCGGALAAEIQSTVALDASNAVAVGATTASVPAKRLQTTAACIDGHVTLAVNMTAELEGTPPTPGIQDGFVPDCTQTAPDCQAKKIRNCVMRRC